MKFFEIIGKVLFNRYLLASAGFCVWVLFFDKNDFFTQRERHAELETLTTKIGYYKSQIDSTQKELSALQNDPHTLEKYAREKYYMKRANEDIYVIVPDSPSGQASQ